VSEQAKKEIKIEREGEAFFWVLIKIEIKTVILF